MSSTISITKTLSTSFAPKKINRDEFIKLMEQEEEFTWLEDSPNYSADAKSAYPPKTVAIWNDVSADDGLWFELNEWGTMDFGYRERTSFDDDDYLDIIIYVAEKLGCYVEGGEENKIFYDPTA